MTDFSSDIYINEHRPAPETTSTDKSLDGVPVDSPFHMTVIKDELAALLHRESVLKRQISDKEHQLLDDESIKQMEIHVRKKDVKNKKFFRTIMRAQKVAKDELQMLCLQLWVTHKDMNILSTKLVSELYKPDGVETKYDSQSSVEKEEPQESNKDSDQISTFSRMIEPFPKVPKISFENSLDLEIKRIYKEISSLLFAIPTNTFYEENMAPYQCRSLYEHLELLLDIREQMEQEKYNRIRPLQSKEDSSSKEAKLSLKSKETESPVNSETGSNDSVSTTKYTSADSDLRRQKTEIVDVARWEQLQWEVPLKDFNIADYQREFNRRYKLAQNVSKRHSQVETWRRRINKHFSEFNEDGTSVFSNKTMSPGLATGTQTYKPTSNSGINSFGAGLN